MKRLEPAGFRIRLVASSIDIAIQVLVSIALMWLVYRESIARIDDMRPASLLINWINPFIWTVALWHFLGATPGKFLTSIRVVDSKTGAAVTWKQSVLRYFGYIVSMLPLGVGYLSIILNPRKQGWHDRLAGTVVLHLVKNKTSDSPLGYQESNSRSYFAAHWHGDLPLAVSFWVNNCMLSIPMGMVVGGLAYWISQKGEYLRATSVATLVAWPLMVAISMWCYVGVWRSASRYEERETSQFWSRVAMCLVVLGFVNIGISTAINFLPRVGGYLLMARGVDPVGNITLTTSADHQRIRIKGPIGMGDGERFANFVKTEAAARVVELDSPGGRIYEANRIADVVRDRKWLTRATGSCASACTLVFLAGSSRGVLGEGQIGLYRASAGTYNPVIEQFANRNLAAIYEEAGLPRTFIQRALATPPWDMWYPSIAEMVDVGLVDAPSQTLDIKLPPFNKSSVADIQEILSENSVWIAMDRRFPETIPLIAKEMYEAQRSGASQDEIMLGAYRHVQQLLPSLLKTTSTEYLDAYLALFAQEVAYAGNQSEALCKRVLSGDPTARQVMPEEWRARESLWLQGAAMQFGAKNELRAPTALELEVMHRSLGIGSPELLGNLIPAVSNQKTLHDCLTNTILMERVNQLPRNERNLAVQFAFQKFNPI